ncbi:hypothetical protein [Amycolatopsis aidingensis]|uniref:hypothetical protein n=1 Tax=Amycolatopsis aidingensis TaxID=2842453 RepID=UPI001E4089FD|nr:hypothetical protein [Amycolatopsis aidingensis]
MTPANTSDSPVLTVRFTDGEDTLLRNPAVTRARLRRHTLLAATSPGGLLAVVLSTGLVIGGITTPGGEVMSWIVAVLGVLAVLHTAIGLVVNGRLDEHNHPRTATCWLERTPGRYVYRGSDFLDLPPTIRHEATGMIDAVAHLHTGPAALRLTRRHLRHIHHLAWRALEHLDRARPAFDTQQPLRDPNLAPATRQATTRIEEDLTHLRHDLAACADLAEAWTTIPSEPGAPQCLHTLLDTIEERLAALAADVQRLLTATTREPTKPPPPTRARAWWHTLRHPLRGERGSASVLVVALSAALIIAIAMAVDGSRKALASSQAASIAEEAARAGGQALRVHALATGQDATVEPQQAADEARAYLAAAGAAGTVTIQGDRLVVRATVTKHTIFLGVLGIGEVSASATGAANLVSAG